MRQVLRSLLGIALILLAATLAATAYPVAWVALRLRRQAARLRGERCPWEDGPSVVSGASVVVRPELVRLVLDGHEADLRAGRARWH